MFKAKYDNDVVCPKCHGAISSGDMVDYADADRKVLQHVDCDGADDAVIRWENVTEETLERTERQQLEELQVAPLGPQGVCPRCFLELPKSKVCGSC